MRNEGVDCRSFLAVEDRSSDVDGVFLQLGRQRAGQAHALHRQDFADLVDSELDLAAPDRLGDITALAQCAFATHFSSNSQSFENFRAMLPAGPGLRVDVDHRARREQRALEGFGGGNIGQRRLLVHRHADADARDRPAAARGYPAVALELRQHLARHDHHVGPVAARERLHQLYHRLVVELHRMPRYGSRMGCVKSYRTAAGKHSNLLAAGGNGEDGEKNETQQPHVQRWPDGSVTTDSQNASIDFTTVMNLSRSTGLVT